MLYLLEYHSVCYACSISLLFVDLTHKLLLWGLPSINELSPLLLWYILRQCCWYVVSMFLVINSSAFSTLLLSNVCIGCYSVDVFRWSAARNSALILCYWFNPKVIEQLPLLSCCNVVKYFNFAKVSFCCLKGINMLFSDVVM